ncbi:MAG: SigE family RNA polymerase sigma factor [Hamadaea sp.]|uniref:SigE family RNA polymerase sigma factor n=1 Tax=Hamadaea sp. TaxID=2024425 RepID=UPI0017E3664B|nr:SigE family RNA polymerase sigma factor [Hamadaea sp.]NUT18655.1 SigE family RNA polymerase sigma factor [Hamadaea sp.]
MDEHDRFAEFARVRTPALIRAAYLLTGDQHAAEDLVQSALTKTYARWGRVRHEDPEAYVRTAMYREQVSWWRRRSRQRQLAPTWATPERQADPADHTGLRLAMQEALLQLPQPQRAVIVLRYYEDLSETQVAEILGCSVGTVRSRANRAVHRLRASLPAFEPLLEVRA